MCCLNILASGLATSPPDLELKALRLCLQVDEQSEVIGQGHGALSISNSKSQPLLPLHVDFSLLTYFFQQHRNSLVLHNVSVVTPS